MAERWPVESASAAPQKGDRNVTWQGSAALVRQLCLVYRPADMRSLSMAASLLLALLVAPGCGDDRPPGTAGNESTLVGGPCEDNLDCDERLCQKGVPFPQGICTISCPSSNLCPSGSSCAETTLGWLCLVDCDTNSDCREGYACEPMTEAGTSGSASVLVCIASDTAS